jgi:hypothetical protein
MSQIDSSSTRRSYDSDEGSIDRSRRQKTSNNNATTVRAESIAKLMIDVPSNDPISDHRDYIMSLAKKINKLLDLSGNIHGGVKKSIVQCLDLIKNSAHELNIKATNITEPIQVDAEDSTIKSMFSTIIAKLDKPTVSPQVQSPSVAKKLPRSSLPTKPTYSVIVSATSESPTTSAETRSLIQQSANPRTLGIGGTLSTLANGKIRMQTSDQDSLKKFTAAIANSSQLKADIVKKRLPMVILKGVNKGFSDDDIVDAIWSQNASVAQVVSNKEESGIRVAYRRKNFNRPENCENIVIESATLVYQALLKVPDHRINIDYQRVHCQPQSSFLQCYKCNGFGHTSLKCTSPKDICTHCAGEHKFASCPNKLDRQKSNCSNCTASNAKYQKRDSVNHPANSPNCPHVLRIKKRNDEMTAYNG